MKSRAPIGIALIGMLSSGASGSAWGELAQTRVNAIQQLKGLPAPGPSGAPVAAKQRCADPLALRVSDHRIQVGSNWSVANPCVFRWGTQFVSLTGAFLVDLQPAAAGTAGLTGSLRVSVGRDALQVTVEGASSDAQAAALVSVSGAPTPVAIKAGAAFPLASVPLFQWALNGGALSGEALPLLTSNVQVNSTLGFGTYTALGPAGPLQVMTDTAYIGYLGGAPSGPGPCQYQGTGIWAIDASYLYVCVPDGRNGFQWGRVSLTNW